MKVCIYHPFGEFPDNYSLSHVVKEQMWMLQEHGIETHFVTSQSFNEIVSGLNTVLVHAVLPYNNAEKIYKSCEPILKEMDAVLTHDVAYLGVYQDHADALKRIAQENPRIKWLHWAHSAPNINEKKQPFPNSIYVGMNYTDLPLLAQQFQVPLNRCQVIYNPVSPDVFFGWHPFTTHIVKKHKLLECDVLVTYPLDTGRFASKGGYKIIKLIEKMREQGKDAKVVFVNAAANAKERRKLVEATAQPYAIFTSQENKDYEVCVPRQVVRELFQISNLFPLLSDSEGCSLTLLEAALCKNLIVLNEDFPAMREFGEIDHVLYMKVSSTRAHTNYSPDEDSYYRDQAKLIIAELEANKALRFNRKALNKFNREWIFKNQLEPLL